MAERAERPRSRSSRSRSRSARRRQQFRGAATEDSKESEDRIEKVPVPMNASFKDITNPNQRAHELINNEATD